MPLCAYPAEEQRMPASVVLSMKHELQRIFDDVPADESRSRLEPYRELILRMRRQGRTYHRIRKVLADKCGVTVAYATLYEFIQTRSRPRKTEDEPQPQTMAVLAQPTEQPAARTYTKLSPEEAAAQRAVIKALRNKPAVVHTEDRPVFVYDPDKPLTNKQN